MMHYHSPLKSLSKLLSANPSYSLCPPRTSGISGLSLTQETFIIWFVHEFVHKTLSELPGRLQRGRAAVSSERKRVYLLCVFMLFRFLVHHSMRKKMVRGYFEACLQLEEFQSQFHWLFLSWNTQIIFSLIHI